MKECKFCKKHLDDNEMTCGYCGYDFKTGAMDPSFDPNKPNKKTRHKNGGVSPVIKKFVTIGILILVVSLTYKYMFNIKAVVVDFLSSATREALGSKKNTNMKAKGAAKTKVTDSKPQKMELRDVRFYEKEDKAGKYKDLKVEGIFFDPSGKSFVTINGKVLSEGESINGIEIEKIYSDSVELKVKGETKVLGVNQSMPF